MTQAATSRHSGRLLSRLAAWTARPLERLSDRIHAGGDAIARKNGWEITREKRSFGFSARTYHDPRFAYLAPGTSRSSPQVGTSAASSTSHPDAASAAVSQHHDTWDREEGTHVRDHLSSPR
jgi:hypothetical protein